MGVGDAEDGGAAPQRPPRFIELVDPHLIVMSAGIGLICAITFWWAQFMYLCCVATMLTHFHDRWRHGWGHHWTYLAANSLLIAAMAGIVCGLRHWLLD